MQDASPERIQPLKVWDIYTRLFHWSLGIAILVSFLSEEEDMELHTISGIVVIALLAFRLLWGLLGPETAQFHKFIRGPETVRAYLRNSQSPEFRSIIGHNPLGALSIVALLMLVAIQAITGLFAHDDIYTEGPLAKFVSSSFSDFITEVHEANSNLLLAMIALHIVAVLFYLFMKRENLIRPMISGEKRISAEEKLNLTSIRERNPLIAAAAIAAAAALAYYIYTI